MKSPLNLSWKSEWPSLTILAASVLTSVLSYAHLPERVASHWNVRGEVDAWTSRDFHAWFFPALLSGIYLLLVVVPSMDPRRERYVEFARVYNIFRNLILLVLFSVFLLATLFNVGYDVNIGKSVPFIIGLLMLVIGNYMGKLKRNWFVGIRTPWTLSSDNIWAKTHRLGGLMFVAFGLLLMATPYLPTFMAMPTLFSGIFMAVVLPFAYSYYLFRQSKKL